MKTRIILLLTFVSVSSFAQERSAQMAGLEYSREKMQNDSIKGYSDNLNAFLNFPISKSDKQRIGGRIQFRSKTISNTGQYFDHHLYSIDLNVSWQKNIKDNAQFYLFSQFGFYSDFIDLSTEDFRYSAGFRYVLRHNDKLQTGWGMAYSRQYFGHQLNPFFSIEYDISSKLRLSGLLPIRPKLTYTLSENVFLSSEISGSAGSYRLSALDNNNRFIRINQWYSLSSLGFTLRKQHCISIGLGYNLRQTVRLYDDGQDRALSIFTFDIKKKSTPVAEVKTRGAILSVSYSFKLK